MSTPRELAAGFVSLLRRDLTPYQFACVRLRNIRTGSGVCASHDFTDANMIMAEAFEAVTGRAPATGYETDPAGAPIDEGADVRAEADSILWSAAWKIAKADYLTGATQADHLAMVAGHWSDYPAGTLPPIPRGFIYTDSGMAPLFESTSRGLRIVVDFADRALREEPAGWRFTVYAMGAEGGAAQDLFDSDDWNAVLEFLAKHGEA